MWQPWNLGGSGLALPLIAASALVFAWVCAGLLAHAAWALPRRLIPLPEYSTAAHRRGRLWLFAAAPVVAATCLWLFGATPAALAALVFVLCLLTLAWIDAQTGLLPDLLTLPLLWLGLLVNLRGGFVALPDAVLGAVAGYLILWCVYWAFRLCTGREGLGRGDFKLLAAVGAWLGWAALPPVLLLASVLGLAAVLLLRAAGRMRLGDPLSFGPCIAAGGVAALLRLGAG